MKWLIIFGLLAVLAWYAALGRDWLQGKPWAAPFYSLPWVQWIEIKFWKKSQTILWARFKMLVGAVLAALVQLGSIDLTPLMPFVPDAYEPMVRAVINLLPLLITVVGMADEKNRNNTTKPIEIVAVPEEAPPEVMAKIMRVEAANVAAVATVEEAKAEGKV